MKILVTGGAGFIGSNIVDAYINYGNKVVVIDNLSSGKKSNVNKKAAFYKVDVTDKKRVEEIFEKEKVEIVNHLAAQIDVRKSVEDPGFDAKINILGTLNLLEAAKKNKVKKVIFSSSGGTIYGECGSKAPDENAPANPLSPYGITKYSAEVYLKYYAELFNLKYTVLRYANVFGPRQDPHGEAGVVAIFSEKMLYGDKLLIFGNGKQMRDYVYVGDVVRANVLALKKGDNNTFNIGTGKLTSVNDLYKKLAKTISYKKAAVHKPARAGELYKSFLDIQKASKILGWRPEVLIEDGLKNTVEYFKNKK